MSMDYIISLMLLAVLFGKPQPCGVLSNWSTSEQPCAGACPIQCKRYYLWNFKGCACPAGRKQTRTWIFILVGFQIFCIHWISSLYFFFPTNGATFHEQFTRMHACMWHFRGAGREPVSTTRLWQIAASTTVGSLWPGMNIFYRSKRKLYFYALTCIWDNVTGPETALVSFILIVLP